MFFLRFCLY